MYQVKEQYKKPTERLSIVSEEEDKKGIEIQKDFHPYMEIFL